MLLSRIIVLEGPRPKSRAQQGLTELAGLLGVFTVGLGDILRAQLPGRVPLTGPCSTFRAVNYPTQPCCLVGLVEGLFPHLIFLPSEGTTHGLSLSGFPYIRCPGHFPSPSNMSTLLGSQNWSQLWHFRYGPLMNTSCSKTLACAMRGALM